MKHCKRVLLTAIAILAMSTVTAQNISFKQGDNGNGKAYLPTLIKIDKADADGRYYSVEPDLNAFTLRSAMTMVAGTARSMGIKVEGQFPENI